MSRFRQALAATAMAVAAAGGGLLIAAAGATPAWASAPPAPHTAHVITITAHPRAQAASRIGPHDIQPCAVKPGSAIKPASCGDQSIICQISAGQPGIINASPLMGAEVSVFCDHDVTTISMQASLLLNGNPQTSIPDTVSGTNSDVLDPLVHCLPGTWNSGGSAFITFPPGFVITGGQNPIRAVSNPVFFPAGSCPTSGGGGGGDGGGGGGGCALPAPSLAGHPAGRHPDFVACP